MSVFSKSFILVIFVLILGNSHKSFAQQNTADGIIFDAEDATISGYDQKNQVIKLKKKVQIIYEGQYIGCDEASIDTNKSLISCKGNVRLVGPEAKLEAGEIELNYKSNTGIIKNGFVQVGQVLFEGDEIKKMSATRYQTVHGKYTACTTCPPFWSFSGSKVDAEIGGYAHIKNALIYFGKVPALWFPYLIVPLKSERQSGLLFPSYQYSDSSGFTISDSFFWAMSDSTDSTWTAKYYTNRGLKGLVNYRYMASTESKGELDFGFLNDRVFANEMHTPNTPATNYNQSGGDIHRWFLKYQHQYFLPYGFIQRMDINAVSDSLYLRDFSKEIKGRGDPSLENRVSLTKNTDYSHWSLDTTYYKSLLNANPLESNYLSVHRFPEINYSIMPTRIFDSNFLFNVNLNYVNFTRDNLSYDDVALLPALPDGKFDPNSLDRIRTGQRLTIDPTITYPINIGEGFNITPSASYIEKRYQFSVGDDPSTYRRYLRTNLSMNTHFSRIYGEENPAANRYKHVIQPDITYTSVPWYDQPAHAFFANDNWDSNFKKDQPANDKDSIQFDYNDRIYDKDIVTYSVSNKIWRKRYVQGTPEYVQIISHKLSQSYDIHEENRHLQPAIPPAPAEKRQPWSEISSLLDLRFDNFETNSLIKFYPYQKDTEHATRVKVYDSRNDYLQLTYSQSFLITNGSTDFTAKTRDIIGGIGFKIKYLELEWETTYDMIKDSYQAYRFNAKFKPPGNCWAIIFTQEKKTDSEKEYDLNVSFLFDGKSEAGLSQN